MKHRKRTRSKRISGGKRNSKKLSRKRTRVRRTRSRRKIKGGDGKARRKQRYNKAAAREEDAWRNQGRRMHSSIEIDMLNTRKTRINEELNRLGQEKRNLHREKFELIRNGDTDGAAAMEEHLLMISNDITINKQELVDINRQLASNVKGGRKLSRKRTHSRKIRSRRKVKGAGDQGAKLIKLTKI
jgi:hypothetical protein